jgi:hypothetical protein
MRARSTHSSHLCALQPRSRPIYLRNLYHMLQIKSIAVPRALSASRACCIMLIAFVVHGGRSCEREEADFLLIPHLCVPVSASLPHASPAARRARARVMMPSRLGCALLIAYLSGLRLRAASLCSVARNRVTCKRCRFSASLRGAGGAAWPQAAGHRLDSPRWQPPTKERLADAL